MFRVQGCKPKWESLRWTPVVRGFMNPYIVYIYPQLLNLKVKTLHPKAKTLNAKLAQSGPWGTLPASLTTAAAIPDSLVGNIGIGIIEKKMETTR